MDAIIAALPNTVLLVALIATVDVGAPRTTGEIHQPEVAVGGGLEIVASWCSIVADSLVVNVAHTDESKLGGSIALVMARIKCQKRTVKWQAEWRSRGSTVSQEKKFLQLREMQEKYTRVR